MAHGVTGQTADRTTYNLQSPAPLPLRRQQHPFGSSLSSGNYVLPLLSLPRLFTPCGGLLLVDEYERMTPEVVEAIKAAVREALSADSGKKYIDVSRIPLICQSIVGIHDTLTEMKADSKEIKENITRLDEKFAAKKDFNLVQRVVFGGILIILTGVMIALMVKIIPGFRLN